MRPAVGDEVLYPDLSHAIMQCAFEVHNKLGPGFTEDIYEEAMIVEMELPGMAAERQKAIDVFYKGRFLGKYRLDLVVDGKVIVEPKAVSAVNEIFKQQLLSYLRASRLRLGLLINFGAKRVESHRVIA